MVDAPTKLELVTKTVYPLCTSEPGRAALKPGPRPSDPAVIEMMVATISRFVCKSDFDVALAQCELPPPYTSLDEFGPEHLFEALTFEAVAAAENYEYIHYVFSDGEARYHLIEVHESNNLGAVFVEGAPRAVVMTLWDGALEAESPDHRDAVAPLNELLYDVW